MGFQRVTTSGGVPLRDLPSYNARDLVKEGEQAHITLDDQVYVLRITRAGKLILTK